MNQRPQELQLQVLPAGVTVAGAGLVAEDALAECPEAAELLDVDVQQLTRAGARSDGPAVAAEHPPDRRGWQAELAGDDQRPRLRELACRQDPLLELSRKPPRLPLRHRRPVGQRRPATLLVAPPQAVTGRAARTAGGRGRLRTLTSKNKRNETTTRLERVAHPSRRLHSVEHSGPPQRAGISTTTSLAGGPDTISRLAGV